MSIGSMGIGQNLLESAWGVNGLLVFDGRALPIHTLYPVLVTDVRRWVAWHLRRFRETHEPSNEKPQGSSSPQSSVDADNEKGVSANRIISPELGDRVRKSADMGNRSGVVADRLRLDVSAISRSYQEAKAFEQELEGYLSGEYPITPTLPHLEWRQRLVLDLVQRGELDIYAERVLQNSSRATTDKLPSFLLNLDAEVPYLWVTQHNASVVEGTSQDFEARLVSDNELFERMALEIKRHPERNEEDVIFEDFDIVDGAEQISESVIGETWVEEGPNPFAPSGRRGRGSRSLGAALVLATSQMVPGKALYFSSPIV